MQEKSLRLEAKFVSSVISAFFSRAEFPVCVIGETTNCRDIETWLKIQLLILETETLSISENDKRVSIIANGPRKSCYLPH